MVKKRHKIDRNIKNAENVGRNYKEREKAVKFAKHLKRSINVT